MSLHFSLERLQALGIGSPYASPQEFYITDPANASRQIIDTARVMLSWAEVPEVLMDVAGYQNRIGMGFSGLGMDWTLLSDLFPTVYWFAAIMLIRYLCRKPFAWFGIYMGIVTENTACHRRRIAAGLRGIASLSPKNQKKILKFQNQAWLSVFYIVSSCFGYYVQRRAPWFRLPLDDEASLNILLPHPYNPPTELLMYYHYGLAFYFAELVSLTFIEHQVRRSDYLEYAVHHIITLLLIVCSHIGFEHRVGVYVLFMHDASDIMLSVSKTLHYIQQGDVARQKRYNAKLKNQKRGKTYRTSFFFRYILTEMNLNCCFAVFIFFFFFFRIYCLPCMGNLTTRMVVKVRHGNVNMCVLAILLYVMLQCLHVYWAALIVTMLWSLTTGGERKDIRSDEDPDTEEPSCVHWGSLTESDEENEEEDKRAIAAAAADTAAKAALNERLKRPSPPSSFIAGHQEQACNTRTHKGKRSNEG